MKILKNKGLKRGSNVSSAKENLNIFSKERTSSFSIKLTENNEKNTSNSQTTKCGSSSQGFPPLSSIKAERKTEYQRKPSLVIKHQKPSLCLQKNYNRTISKNKQIIQGQINLPNIFQKIIKTLQNNFILSQKQTNLFLIKKQDLLKLLQNCLLYKSSFQKPQFLENSEQFNTFLFLIWQQIEQEKKRQKTSRLNIRQTIYDNYTSKDYYNDIKVNKQEISTLLAEKLEIQRKTQEIELHLKRLLTSKQNIFQIIDAKQLSINILEEKIKSAQQNLSTIQKTTLQKQQFLSKIQKDYDQLFNFVNNQSKNKHVKLASEDYKLIEADIYDYAAYLQANQLASSLTYQHLPIICHTHDLDQRVSVVNKMLVQNQELSVKEKGRRLRDFLMEVIEKYRKKDIQVEKLMEFKTKCIITFIERMKKWLNNWQFKQEYLKNLRMQHIYNHNKIISLFQQLDTTDLCKSCRMQVQPRKKALEQLFMKMDQNYKMGNSFY